jgi:hypothetical protein
MFLAHIDMNKQKLRMTGIPNDNIKTNDGSMCNIYDVANATDINKNSNIHGKLYIMLAGWANKRCRRVPLSPQPCSRGRRC